MAPDCDHVSVFGSKMRVLRRPSSSAMPYDVPPVVRIRPSASCTWSAQNRSPPLPWFGPFVGAPGTAYWLSLPLGLAPPSLGDGRDHDGAGPERSSTRLWSSIETSPNSATVLSFTFSVPSSAFQYRTRPVSSTTTLAPAGLHTWVPSGFGAQR